MRRWADNAITVVPKTDAPADSWWIKPQLQADYAEFAKRRDAEAVRMNLARFGGHGKIHGDGTA